MTTFAPSWAKQSANSRPMPRPEPVTIATRPSSSPTGSARDRGGGRARDRLDAVLVGDLELDVDEMLAVLLALAGDDSGTGEHVARPHLLGEPYLEAPNRLGPEPVLHHAGGETHREHAVPEHRRVADLA